MIQLSTVGKVGLNNSCKMTEKEGETTCSNFEAILQLTNEMEPKQEQIGVGNQEFPVYQLLQQVMNGPFSNPVMEKIAISESALCQEGNQMVPTLQQVDQENENLGPSFQQVDQKIKNQDSIIQIITETISNKSQLSLNDTIVLSSLKGIQTVPVISQEEKSIELPVNMIENEQTQVDSTPLNLASFRQVTINEKVEGVKNLEVRATQFEQDIKELFQSNIKIKDLADGLEATFSLNPENLGKVKIKLIIQDGQVTAEFLARTLQGKGLLESQVQALRSALEMQGLQVNKIDISQQNNSQFMGPFSQRGDSNERQPQQESKNRNDQRVLKIEEEYHDYVMDVDWISQINTTA